MRAAAVVLAAGAGSRFGGRKLAAPWRDGVVLDAALRAALAAPVERVIVVSGADPATVAGAVARAAAPDQLMVVQAADYAQGLSASLKTGVAAATDFDALLIYLGDMPEIPLEIGAALLARIAAGAPAALPVCEGRRGHPVALSGPLLADLESLSGDEGARRLLLRLGDAVAEVAVVNRGVLLDIDTPADLEKLAVGRPGG